MALPMAQVLVLEDVMRLVRLDVPHLVDIRGAESVRAAAEMAALLNYKLGRAKVQEEHPASTDNGREEEGEEGGGGGCGRHRLHSDSDADAEEYEFGFGDSGDDDSDDEGEAAAEDDDDDKGSGNGWIVPKMHVLLRVAEVADLLEEVSLDVIPKLKKDPTNVVTLHRLLAIGKEMYNNAKFVPGKAGEMSVKLSLNLKKMVSHAFNKRSHKRSNKGRGAKARGQAIKRRKARRTKAERDLWVASRLRNLTEHVEEVHGCPFRMD